MYLYIILTNCDLNKVADILQMSFQNAFIWKNSPNIYQTKIAQMDCWFAHHIWKDYFKHYQY